VDQATGIIVAACNESTNRHDSKTIPDVLDQCERLVGAMPTEAFVDRGYRGADKYKSCLVQVPGKQQNISRKQRKRHSKRAGIEPIIGHLKTYFRLSRNFYKGTNGDIINVMLAAAAMNFKRVINLWRTEAIISWFMRMIRIIRQWHHYALKVGF
jgi:IS5 family transposase